MKEEIQKALNKQHKQNQKEMEYWCGKSNEYGKQDEKERILKIINKINPKSYSVPESIVICKKLLKNAINAKAEANKK